jgi:hypothetical protein
MNTIEEKYGHDRVRKHLWQWKRMSGSRPDGWAPQFTFREGLSVEETWEEYSVGLDGRLGWRELEEGWGTEWRSGSANMRSIICKRNKIISLVDKLAKKPKWSPHLALEFLKDRYPVPSASDNLKTTCAFITALTKDKGAFATEILAASDSWLRRRS